MKKIGMQFIICGALAGLLWQPLTAQGTFGAADPSDFLWTFEDPDGNNQAPSIPNGGNQQVITAVIGSLTTSASKFGSYSLSGMGRTGIDQLNLTNSYSKMSMLFWVNKNNATGPSFAWRPSGGVSLTTTGSFVLGFNVFAPTFRFWDASGAATAVSFANFSVTSGQWSHVALTFDNGVVTWYSNAVQRNSTTLGASFIPAANPSSRLELNPTTFSFLDDFAIIDEVLTQSQIEYLYLRGVEAFNVPEPSSLLLAVMGGLCVWRSCRAKWFRP